MKPPLPSCDVCTPLGFGRHQQHGETALYVPARHEWLCAHCRGGDAKPFVPGVYRPGQPGYIQPGSPEHLLCISLSKVPAILGVSRWQSPYRLWHRMAGLVPPEEPKDIFDVGHDWEPAAANRWRRHNPGWRLSPGEVQFVGVDSVSGFPYVCTLDRRATRGRAKRIVELKTARHMEDWGDDFTDACPEDYAAQVIAQAMFTGWTAYPAHMLVLGPFFNDHIYEIPYDHGVAVWIRATCRDFYRSLHRVQPPPLDDTVATYECVRELHPDIDAGGTADLEPGQAWELLQANAELKAAETRLRSAKTVVLDRMKRAQYAEVERHRIAERRDNGKGGVSLYISKKTTAADIESLRGDVA